MTSAHLNKSEGFYDAVLIGAGIMSSTLAVLLHELDPELRVLIVERLPAPGLESTAAINNAGTGHAANCELNYTPINLEGTIETRKALEINASFERSLEFWASLTLQGRLHPEKFMHLVPHISFVWGNSDVDFLLRRYKQLKEYPAFASMRLSQDHSEIKEWIPIVMKGRSPDIKIASTRIDRGTDVDFGALTNAYLEMLNVSKTIEIDLNTEVVDLRKYKKGTWEIDMRTDQGERQIRTSFVFIGAGGGALTLLQKSGIPEAEDYAGFPVSGQWLVCSDPSLVVNHNAKVYGKAKVGAPPMSVPHLDTRWIADKQSLLFGPFAGFSSKFLKQGSRLDLFKSVRPSNLFPMLQVGFNNIDLVKYLLVQLKQSEEERLDALREFLPFARQKDWTLSVAGQRVQIIKRTVKGGRLKMGTEVVSSRDGSLAALLGASPGASTSVSIMLEVLQRCWSREMETEIWRERLKKLLPSYEIDQKGNSDLIRQMRQRTDSILKMI